MNDNTLAVFDIEAVSAKKNKDLVMIGWYDGIEYQYFTKINDFLDYLLKPIHNNYFIYSHFGGKYDMLFIFEAKEYIFSKGYTIEDIIIISGAILSFSIKKYKYNKPVFTIKFADSYRILLSSLKKLTDDFNVSHKKLDFDFKGGKEFKLTPENIEYNKFDCIGLYEILNIFFSKYANDIGFTISIASTSLKVFTSKFLKEPLYVLNKNTEDFIRKSYYGGRCEVFKKHLDKGFYYDVNSLYPYVMTLEMPAGFYYEVLEFEKDKIGFYNCDVYIPENLNIPPIPFKYKNKLIFPVGKLKDIYLTSAELNLLKSLGGDYYIKSGIVFEDKKYIFKEFVDYYYKMKLEAEKTENKSDRHIAKLFMNSLYGKFGQKRENEKYFFIDNLNIDLLKNDIFLYDFDLNLYYNKQISKSKNILPYLSSYITSLARVELYKHMQSVNFDVYYCDTDSLFTKTELKPSSSLGALKLEGIVENFTFNAPKDYYGILNGKELIKKKGFFKDQAENETIIKLCSFKETIKNNKNVLSSKYKFLKDKKIIKKSGKNEDKRVFLNNDSIPFNFN